MSKKQKNAVKKGLPPPDFKMDVKADPIQNQSKGPIDLKEARRAISLQMAKFRKG